LLRRKRSISLGIFSGEIYSKRACSGKNRKKAQEKKVTNEVGCTDADIARKKGGSLESQVTGIYLKTRPRGAPPLYYKNDGFEKTN